jgi:hypothetical protein
MSLSIAKTMSLADMLEASKKGWGNLMFELKCNYEKEIVKIGKIYKNKGINKNGLYCVPSFIGNPVLYDIFAKELFATPREKAPSIKQMFESDELRLKCLEMCRRYPRRKKSDVINARDMMEAWRRMRGCVGTFKPSSVIPYLQTYKATKYLDPCAGWGGRYLAAFMMGVEYIGYDTNTNLIPMYKDLGEFCKRLLPNQQASKMNMKMKFKSCLSDEPFEPFDFCLTGPPYCMVEKYTGMVGWNSWEDYHKDFLVPLIIKLKKYAMPNAFIGINVSEKIMETCLTYLPKEHHPKGRESLCQQMGGKKNKEIIFIF